MTATLARSGAGMGPPVQAHGRIVSVDSTDLGSTLLADTAAGATELVVVNAADFPAQGGNLTINGQTIAYTAVDDATGTISLDDALDADADEGDDVSLWDDYRNDVAAQMRALVQFDGDDGGGDPVGAVVSQYLSYTLDEGVRGDTGESVILEHKDGIWRVVDVLGHVPIINLSYGTPATQPLRTWFENTDQATATGPGVDVVIALTHRPLLGSLHVYWNGLAQRPGLDFTWDGNLTVTLTDPNNMLLAGDLLEAAYAYEVGSLDDYTPDLIGTSDLAWSDTGPATLTIAIPAGTAAGDLIILAAACDYSGLDPAPNNAKVFCDDPRVARQHSLRSGKVLIAWGYADGTGTPITLTFPLQTGHSGDIEYRVAALAVYRGATVGAYQDSQPTGTAVSTPSLPDTAAAVAICTHQANIGSPSSPDEAGTWTKDEVGSSSKIDVALFHWSGARSDSPPGAFDVHETDGITTMTTMRLEVKQ